ncbi:hypothetical protein ABH926_005454 [Catenulispora sp. GP43]|uniref:hypothetical protein n=1 Tax=Catenulispora sp. GP43 TaxID=3156263 RepID=UPI00351869DF
MDSDKRHDQLWSRRGVVKGAAGAATVGALTLVSPRAAQAETAPAADRPDRPDRPDRGRAAASAAVPAPAGRFADGETMTVHLRDARTGELDIYVGERHVRVRDRDLAARLIAAAR